MVITAVGYEENCMITDGVWYTLHVCGAALPDREEFLELVDSGLLQDYTQIGTILQHITITKHCKKVSLFFLVSFILFL